ncbi:glycoside hydrolase family 113 [Olleya sp. Bg11-27]|uniref:glycoside hydrolase family 113 n=1 Tax=Olleya sp. Bg11-27 TaxID=2058135 RepID=UPI000C30F22D|nr:glycoside hydrolase [Olleya sp. Bg11-27]AUC75167.1 glycoside hydrolase [Olleya sp. Bg11-27]
MRGIQILLLIVLLQSCTAQDNKINGVSFVAHRDSITQKNIDPLVNINANYASIMPFGVIKDLAHPEISYGSERQWFGETKIGGKQYVKALKKDNIKIMLKPQIWVWRGEFTGFITMKSEADWKILETTYSKYILEFAQVAQDSNAEIFCIGTELEKFVEQRPDYWTDLIKKVRAIYKGKLTYAANWNEYLKTPFWEQLDYIGIDAYFPVSDSKTPTIEECLAGWVKHKKNIKAFSEKYGKPILFTEFGYRSIDYAGKAPWTVDRIESKVNLDAQSNTTKALFQTFWKEDWFAGGFVWKWFINHDRVGGIENNRFTPQNKPAEQVIKSQYNIKG